MKIRYHPILPAWDVSAAPPRQTGKKTHTHSRFVDGAGGGDCGERAPDMGMTQQRWEGTAKGVREGPLYSPAWMDSEMQNKKLVVRVGQN